MFNTRSLKAAVRIKAAWHVTAVAEGEGY